MTSAEFQSLNFCHHFSLLSGNNNPYSSTSHRCWTDWLVNVQKLLWGWKVPIIIIMLSKKNFLPFKWSHKMVTDIFFECSASHRWNIYLPIKKNISTEKSFLKFVHLFWQDMTKLLPWNVTGATCLRSMSRPMSAKSLSFHPEVLVIKHGFAFCQSHVTSNTTNINLNHIQNIMDVYIIFFPSKILWTYNLSPWLGVNNGFSEASVFISLFLYWGSFYIYTSEGLV